MLYQKGNRINNGKCFTLSRSNGKYTHAYFHSDILATAVILPLLHNTAK